MAEPRTSETIAYFSMEIGLEEGIPTYSGGLGMLAGDTVRSAADLAIPMVAVSLLHRKGYFRQRLTPDGTQIEDPVEWSPAEHLRELPTRAQVEIEGRNVALRAWCYDAQGVGGYVVPVYLLDADLPENSDWDRHITDSLYGGDDHYRLCQEVVLGIGGVRMLRALGYQDIKRFHMNEGHASLLVVELVHERALAQQTRISRELTATIKPLCVFTTHTPVPAGHDKFPLELVARVVTGYGHDFDTAAVEFCLDGVLNMTYLALDNSHFVNGVAKKHGEISRHMFAQYKIDSITNGVHVGTWAAPSLQALFDRNMPGWKEDNMSLRRAVGLPKFEVWDAHRQAKQALLRHVLKCTGVAMELNTFTIGFARRATAWKRADLLFWDVDRLLAMLDTVGEFQIVYGGKAHPHDQLGKEVIKRIYEIKNRLAGKIKMVYLEEYDMALAKLMIAGVDVWLNIPQAPLEASGTSGMKAAVNGVPSLSILDGWWIEGCIEGLTGWAIGGNQVNIESDDDRAHDAGALYDKLEKVILPMFYSDRERYIDVMRHAIALNGSFFNTERMVDQYVRKAYFQ
jgi:starch phosphorylase